MSKLTVISEDHVAGPADAPVTLIEYGDYQCPSCGESYPIVKKLQKHFGDRLRFVFRNFPLPMHPYAEHAAEAAEFAAAQGKFWEMHDALYEHQRDLADHTLLAQAKKLGLNGDDLTQALADGTYAKRVQTDMKTGEAADIPGTPTFFLNGRMHEGSFDYDTLRGAIEAAGAK